MLPSGAKAAPSAAQVVLPSYLCADFDRCFGQAAAVSTAAAPGDATDRTADATAGTAAGSAETNTQPAAPAVAMKVVPESPPAPAHDATGSLLLPQPFRSPPASLPAGVPDDLMICSPQCGGQLLPSGSPLQAQSLPDSPPAAAGAARVALDFMDEVYGDGSAPAAGIAAAAAASPGGQVTQQPAGGAAGGGNVISDGGRPPPEASSQGLLPDLRPEEAPAAMAEAEVDTVFDMDGAGQDCDMDGTAPAGSVALTRQPQTKPAAERQPCAEQQDAAEREQQSAGQQVSASTAAAAPIVPVFRRRIGRMRLPPQQDAAEAAGEDDIEVASGASMLQMVSGACSILQLHTPCWQVANMLQGFSCFKA